MTYTELANRLHAAGIETAEWEASLLIEHFCAVDATLVRMEPEQRYESAELDAAVKARESRYPLQYLLGSWGFFHQTYLVTPDCLIPRSDTEILVEEAIRRLPEGARFLDLCTGSGCIAVSTLAERPDTTAVAVDKFENTLRIATQNAEKNGVGNRFTPLLADVLEKLPPSCEGLFDAIVANPPYITTETLKSLAPEVQAEPRAALDGGDDGLLFYRRILELHTTLLTPNGFLLFEIGYDQAAAVLELGASHGFIDGRVLCDLGGNTRVVVLKRS
ncbi:MAG: peptide chain release factor N(5)-glutamine methyltransferase [Ruminococcaceae bacterium]|nr:peptide chain release factor N(5)-glutamine methyltransferase [Oscillospiraceae bacterium]